MTLGVDNLPSNITGAEVLYATRAPDAEISHDTLRLNGPAPTSRGLNTVITMNIGCKLKKTTQGGEGVFATESFTIGDVVMIGVIEKVLDKNNRHASQVGEHLYVLHAGLASKVNHSCDPRCGIKTNKSGAHDLVARKNIGVGEEITFDYAMRNYVVEYFKKRCSCGAPNCRGKISGWKDLPQERKKEYEGFVAPYLLALDTKYSHEETRPSRLREKSLPRLSLVVR
jgi:uncharacterized protein